MPRPGLGQLRSAAVLRDRTPRMRIVISIIAVIAVLGLALPFLVNLLSAIT